MAPRRKRGGTEVKTNMELKLGDLVLAKVKGFPAWPAKICRPEDWDRSPEPKKIFVEFFGTSEIAFLAPADIQSFTGEAKNKLCARRQGKAIKFFAQAVTDICEEFEAMQTKSIVRTDYDNARNLASEKEPVEVDEAVRTNYSKDNVGPICRSETKGLDRCSQREGEMEHKDVRHRVSSRPSSGKRKKLSSDSNLIKEAILDSPDAKVECLNSDGVKKEFTTVRQAKKGMEEKIKLEGTKNTKNGSARLYKLIGDGMPTKSAEMPKVVSDFGNERKLKKLHIGNKDFEAVDDGQVNTDHGVINTNEMKFQHDHEKRISRTNDTSSPAKMSKHGDGVDEAYHFTVEDDQTLLKRQHQSMETMCSSALMCESRKGSSVLEGNVSVRPNNVRTSVMQLQNKRRAVLLCDDVEDDFSKTLLHSRPRTPLHGRPRTPLHGGPRTPIHAGSNNRVSDNPCLSDSKRVNLGETKSTGQVVFRNSRLVGDALKEPVPRMVSVASPTAQRGIKKKNRELLGGHAMPQVPNHINLDKLPVCSPKRSPVSITSTKLLAEHQIKESSKAPGNFPLKNAPSGSSRDPASPSDRSTSSLNHSICERSKPNSSEENRKTSLEFDAQINDSAVRGNLNESLRLLGERLDAGEGLKPSFQVNEKMSDAAMPIKHLIAAAQEKRREAHVKNSCGNPLPLFPDAGMLGRNPSPIPAALAVEVNTMLGLHAVGSHPTSPSSIFPLPTIGGHEDGEHEERRWNSGHGATDSSLSGSTEVAVARDAFEGMIETLSRTKESISRATRLAIDCAKYGIANEANLLVDLLLKLDEREPSPCATVNVVKLLIKKLENEPNFHRKVDLFFLVDSITQCSHSQKGIAGAAYIPIVEAALPRIIGAVAPAGVVAQENRKQCLKVLRLWLERKVLPESVLRHCMDDVGAINDDASTGFCHSRPSQSGRSIDDPLREMEGILVDEYGSNTTFQLLGLLSCNLLKEEEDDEEISGTSLSEEGADAASLHTPASKDAKNYASSPVDRHHCILEDVEGELEMEDVFGHRDGKSLHVNSTLVALAEANSGVIPESASSEDEFLQSIKVTPLPHGSPPTTTPLPTSPPPSSPLPPPPSLPPRSSQPSPPLPLVPPSSLTYVSPSPPVSPPFLFQRSSQPQVASMSQHMSPVTSMMSGSQTLAHQLPPFRHESGDAPPGNQELPNARRMSHINAPVGGKLFSRPKSFSHPAAGSNWREHASYISSRHAEYERGEASFILQTSQKRPSYVTGNTPIRQRPFHRGPPPQRTTNHFSYPNCNKQRQYPSYQLPGFSETPRRYAPDEKWPKRVNRLNTDCRHGDRMTGGNSCSSSHYSLEGPPRKRTHRSTVKFQANNQSAAPVSGNGYPLMPSKYSMSAINRRPTF